MLRWLCVFVVLAAISDTAAAAPVVSVRGRAAVELDPVRRAPGGVLVRGRVLERSSGEPIPYAVVTLVVDGEALEWSTDENGQFERLYALGDGDHDVAVTFRGDSQYEGDRLELAGIDVSKRPLELTLRVPDPIDGALDAVEIVVRAASDGEPAEIAAALRGGPGDSAELELLATVVTDESGRGVVTVDRARLGEPGRLRFELRFAGDATYDPAIAQAAVLLRGDTVVDFLLRDATVDFDDSLGGTGRLSDGRGRGLARQPVALEVGGKKVAQAVTDGDGSFALRVDAADVGAGPVTVQAVFDPDDPALGASRSAPLVATVGEVEPIPVGTTLTAFAATALALLAFVSLRTRPWTRWLAALRPAAADVDARPAKAPLHTGLAPARPGLVSTLRRAIDFGFTGTVRGAVDGRPIPGARVELRQGDELREAIADHAGAFALLELAGGNWIVTACAPGHCRERFPIALPHHGELRSARIDLLPVRERIFDMYKVAAAPLLPDEELWGIWTPRQIVDHVRRTSQAPALSALTEFVEETYFSQRTPDEDRIDLAADLIAAANREAR